MSGPHFRLSEAPCARIRPVLPHKGCRVPRVDDRRAEEQLEQMRPMLDQSEPERRQEILVHARMEAARVVLAIPASVPGEEGEDH